MKEIINNRVIDFIHKMLEKKREKKFGFAMYTINKSPLSHDDNVGAIVFQSF